MRKINASIVAALALVLLSSCGNKQTLEPSEPEPGTAAPVAETTAEAAPAPDAETTAEAASPEAAAEPAPAEAAPAAPEVAKGPDAITLAGKAKPGSVAFPHGKHQEASECKTCHHTTEAGATPVACHTCHGADGKAPAAKEAFHEKCQGCHKESGLSVKCGECHKK